MVPTNLTWDGTIVLFSATDGTFVTTSRMTLSVVPGGNSNCPGCGNDFSGRPPNLRYNGLQGYNLFNASQWDNLQFAAKETRTFRANEKVVVVVGSALLKDAIGRDAYYMTDPFSGSSQTPVVYGTGKIPNPTTESTTTATPSTRRTTGSRGIRCRSTLPTPKGRDSTRRTPSTSRTRTDTCGSSP